ncbi:MAG: hypothetical protein HY304_00755 [candidate division Zixibacteria bacterium]|nr:hypothetical protein [candidate division Zixibacteria bacterium]
MFRAARCSVFLTISATMVVWESASATKYAGEPYYLGVGARALGRGGAFVAATPDGSSSYWNVASLVALRRPEIMVQHAEAFGSLLNHDFAGIGVPPSTPNGWAWGAYGYYLGGAGIQLTVFDSTTGRPKVDRLARHGDWAIGVALARRVPGWGAYGVTAKTVIRDLPGNSAYGLGVDLAWWNQWPSLRAGIKVADVTTTFLSYDSGRKETIVPHVDWGGEVDLPRAVEGLHAVAAFDAETYFENRQTASQYWSGSVSVDLHLGLEVGYRDRLFGRIGSDAGSLAVGAGFAIGRWGVDGALTDHQFLDNTYRVSLRYRLR